MTYNFDPDRWFENQRRALDLRLDRGEMDEAGYQAALSALEARYDAMLTGLDRPFELPDRSRDDRT